MTIKVTKESINLREKLSELDFDKVPFQKMPAGSVVQVQTVRANFTGDVSSSSTNFVEVHSTLRNTFTPKFANSILLFEYHTSSYGWSASYIYFELRADNVQIDTVVPTDVSRSNTGTGGEGSQVVYLEAPSWGTSAKVVSPYFKTNSTTVYANWNGGSQMAYMKITEVAQ